MFTVQTVERNSFLFRLEHGELGFYRLITVRDAV
jgi:hypothetical protein